MCAPISRPRAPATIRPAHTSSGPTPHSWQPKRSVITMPRRPLRLSILLLFALLFFGGPSLVTFYTDWLWFNEAGYRQGFTAMLTAQTTLFTIVFAAAALWLSVNLRVALAAVGDFRPVFTTREGLAITLPGRQQLRTVALAVAVVVAVLVGLYGSAQWRTWLTWRHATAFGQPDPILGYDAGFYVFSLPFLELVRGLGQALVILAALGAGALYLVSGSLTSGFPSMLSMTGPARRHLSLLGAAFFLLLAFGAWLGRAEMLPSPAGVIFGASYADVHGRMPAALLLVIAAIVGAILAGWQATSPRNWPIPVAIGLYVVVSAGGEIYSTLLQRFVVTPNEQARESPYIQHNIEATRRAFALDGVEERELSGDVLLSRDDIERNAA